MEQVAILNDTDYHYQVQHMEITTQKGTNMNQITLLLIFIGTMAPGYAEPIKKSIETPKAILKIEDFLPAKERWTLSSGINILNKSNENGRSGYYINEVGPGQYVIDRTYLSARRETNGVSANLSVMYGITDALSFSTTLNGQWLNTKLSIEDRTSLSNNKFDFNGVGVGASYQMYGMSDFTILFGGMNIKNGGVNGYVLGGVLNWIYDPVVLSFSLGFLDGISSDKFSSDYKASTSTGKIIFAVNPEVNLHWGVSKDFFYSVNHYINKKDWSSTTSLLIGSSVNLMEGVTSNITMKGGVGNNKSSVISLGVSYKI